jgi:uncharacterized protein YneF (UPF0154 family)
MKMLLKILLVLILAGFIVGYYIKEQGEHMGEIIIGIDVLVVAFVLMPLFLYHRYKNKDLSDFKFRGFQQPNKDDGTEEK